MAKHPLENRMQAPLPGSTCPKPYKSIFLTHIREGASKYGVQADMHGATALLKSTARPAVYPTVLSPCYHRGVISSTPATAGHSPLARHDHAGI